jgi:hypothetical protein
MGSDIVHGINVASHVFPIVRPASAALHEALVYPCVPRVSALDDGTVLVPIRYGLVGVFWGNMTAKIKGVCRNVTITRRDRFCFSLQVCTEMRLRAQLRFEGTNGEIHYS